MLSKQKIIDHLIEHSDDTNSELDRFIQDMLIQIEHGQFDPEDEEEAYDPYA